MRSLIERAGGVATVVPSMREVPLDQNAAAFVFADELFASRIDVIVLLTGVGTRALAEVVESRFDRTQFLKTLQRCVIIVRGPKPAAVLREWLVRFDHLVPEPNTWRDLLATIDAHVPVSGKTVAVQEYGKPNEDLYRGLQERGANVLPVPVYRWALPEDTRPLADSVRATIAEQFDVLMFTSAQQLHNVLDVAESLDLRDAWLNAARYGVVASIGPTASENLVEAGLPPDIQPEHPKMGHLVRAAAEQARIVLARKHRA
jgi:uroporphyrinogen-III synthase